MARYLLTSYKPNGPYYGAIYHDGDTLRFWGHYQRRWCMADGKTPRPEVREDIMERDAALLNYACAPVYGAFAILEGSNDAKASIARHLDGLTYEKKWED